MGSIRHPVTADCLGHWTMDGSGVAVEADDSGNNADLWPFNRFIPPPHSIGTIADNPFGDGTTSRNQPLFGAVDEHFYSNDAPTIALFDGYPNFTISAWMRPDSSLSTLFPCTIFSIHDSLLAGGGAYYMDFFLKPLALGGPWRAEFSAKMTGQDIFGLQTAYSMTSGLWYLVTAVIKAGSYAKLYLNAVDSDDATATPTGVTDVTGAGAITCIHSTTSTHQNLPGPLSDIAAYGTAKEPSWVDGIYQGVPPVLTPVDPTNGQAGVSREASISLNVTVAGGSIDLPWTVEVDRGGPNGFELAATVQNAGGTTVFEAPFQGANSATTLISGGYNVVVDPVNNFQFGQSPTVRVVATGNGFDVALA